MDQPKPAKDRHSVNVTVRDLHPARNNSKEMTAIKLMRGVVGVGVKVARLCCSKLEGSLRGGQPLRYGGSCHAYASEWIN
jgi:hypothetical protein